MLFCSSKNVKGESNYKTPYEVNFRMLAYSRALGKGYAALEMFTKYTNMPPPFTKTAYFKLYDKHCKAAEKVGNESMLRAAEEIGKGKDCGVSVDGSCRKEAILLIMVL